MAPYHSPPLLNTSDVSVNKEARKALQTCMLVDDDRMQEHPAICSYSEAWAGPCAHALLLYTLMIPMGAAIVHSHACWGH